MKPKNIVTILLLSFVAVSIIVVLAKETGGRDSGTDQAEIAAVTESHADTGAPSGLTKETRTSVATAQESKYVVAYLHGRARCGPCRTLEDYAKEAVHAHFADDLASGDMEWRIVNVATPENSHLSQHYGLYTQSVIVSEVQNGTEVRWKNLDMIWQLVRDRDAYFDYIKTEVEAFRSGS